MADTCYTALYSTPSPGPGSRRRATGAPPPRASRGGVEFFCGEAEERKPRRHSIDDACSLCRRPLGRFRDIFMYRGDTPFCSEECRQEQIDLDLAREEEEAAHRRMSSSRAARASFTSGPVPASAAAGVLSLRATEAVVVG